MVVVTTNSNQERQRLSSSRSAERKPNERNEHRETDKKIEEDNKRDKDGKGIGGGKGSGGQSVPT